MGLLRLLGEELIGAPGRRAHAEHEQAEIDRMSRGLDMRDY